MNYPRAHNWFAELTGIKFPNSQSLVSCHLRGEILVLGDDIYSKREVLRLSCLVAQVSV